MSEVGELNLGSELNSNTSTSNEDLALFSAFKKAYGERPNSSSPRTLNLRFGNKLSDPVLTGKPISGEDGTDLKIELVDENTNLIVKTGPQSSGKVEIAVLRADTKSDEKEENTPLLNGCTNLYLNKGIGLVGKISFPNRSNWTKKCQCMLMARFVDGLGGISVKEAKSEVFTLKDKRNERSEKHYPPTLLDEVLHLDNIGKRGPYVKRLKNENIITEKNFLTEYFKNHQRLKEILKMPEKKLDKTIKHALSCKELEDKYIYYIPGSLPQTVIVLNVVGQLFGLISNCQFDPIETLSETQKEAAQKLVVSALEHWGDLVPYNEHSFFSGHSGLVSRDHNPPITPPVNGTLSDIFIGQSSDDACHDNCEHDDVQAIAATISYPFEGTSDDLFDHILLGSSVSQGDNLDDFLLDPGFSIYEYYGLDERLKKDTSKPRLRKWRKIMFVLKFSHRRNMEKPGHVKKKPRIN